MKHGSTPDVRVGYVLAIGCVALMMVVRLALDPLLGARAPFLPFVVPVLVAGWYGGARPALVAAGAGLLAVMAFFMPAPFGVADVVHLSLLTLVCGTITFVFEGLHRVRRGLEEHGAQLEREIAGHRRAAAEIERTSAALQRAAERSRLVSETTALLLATGSPQTVLRRVFETIAPHLKLDVFFSYLRDDATGGLRLESCAGVGEDAQVRLRHLAMGQAVCGTVALRRERVIAFHIQGSLDPMVSLVREGGVRAYVCHPLLVGDRLLGTLSFGSRTRDTFEPDEIDLLSTICGHVSVAYEREELLRRLQAADRRKDEFLAMLSHELRNPLAPVRSAAQVLRTRTADPVVRWAGDVIGRQVDHLVRLLEDLLDTSRIVHGKLVLRREVVELAPVLHAAVESSRPLIESRRHALELEIPDRPLHVNADPIRLAQVFTNLLNNAAHYTDPGGHIRLEASRIGNEVRVIVQDDGIGMSAASLSRVFEPFVQEDGAGQRSSGLGLGLALVRGLLALHGGTIEARSVGPGHGCTFEVRLRAHEAPRAIMNGASAPHGEVRESRRTLIVDDVADGADSLAMLLRLNGHEVHVTYDALAALETADRLEPEVILLDLGMPGMDGLDICRRLRERPWGRRALIVAVTGWGRDEDRQRTGDAGFDHHLVKPVNVTALERLMAGHAAPVTGVPASPAEPAPRG